MDLSNTFLTHFDLLPDPRQMAHPNKRYDLKAMLVIAILAVICGANGWVEIAAFGRAKRQWLESFLPLPYGVPSHDTFGRVFSLINADLLEHCFLTWLESIVNVRAGKLIAIDGKTLRGSHERSKGCRALHMVSAWAVENRLVLGQTRQEAESNEFCALEDLLTILDIRGSTITMDAGGCHTSLAKKILAQKADYVLTLKANQKNLYEDVKELFLRAEEKSFKQLPHQYYETIEKGHGRLETRCYWLTDLPKNSLIKSTRWPGLQSVGMVRTTREKGDKIESGLRFYLTSFTGDIKRFAYASRNHWQVETVLHWGLDVSFHEDLCRVRKGHAAENLSVLRRIALNLLKQEKAKKVGIACKRKISGWNNDYLAQVLMCGSVSTH